ncbi:outer membrane beta-barrel protein [Paraflavisolibacter sp. H34]|uniref:type IX secretion/gliding motility protein PorT/SprT n=1 Tax=Huijunlia imazamoxiresistens TaxID=3127457 RepID=UPI003018ADF3
MLYLLRKKTPKLVHASLLLFGTVLSLSSLRAQERILHQEDHDNKPYYFGITLSAASARFDLEHHSSFLQQDSVMVAEPLNSPAFALGLVGTLKLVGRLEARFNPQIIFADRTINYKLRYAENDLQGTNVDKRIESTIVTFPVNLKFNSDRIGNFRAYVFGGGKFDFDLASNARARKSEDLVKINKFDRGIEAGMGLNFYFPSFIFSPEIKISRGINNIHSRDESLKYSSVLDRIQSRMIIFSIHLEG